MSLLSHPRAFALVVNIARRRSLAKFQPLKWCRIPSCFECICNPTIFKGNYSCIPVASKLDDVRNRRLLVDGFPCNRTPRHGQYSNEVEKREAIVTVPNVLSAIRICITPGIGYCVLTGHFAPALALTFIAGVTDLLDGFIARRFPSQASVLGSVLDPAADKILVSTLVVTLTLTNLLPVWLCVLIVGRDVGLIAAVSYLRFITLDPPRTFWRFFDAGHPTVQLKPTLISKVNTMLQLIVVWCSLAAPVFDFAASPLLSCLHYLVGSTTFVTAVDYVRKSGTFRVLRNTNKTQQR